MQHYYPFSRGSKKHPYLGSAFAVVATVSGAMGIVIIKVFKEMPSLQISAFWLFLGSFVSLSINYLGDRNKTVASIATKKTRYLLLQTAVSTGAAVCLTRGISLLNPSTGSFINATIFILASILIGKIAFGDRLNFWQLLGISGTLVGLSIITFENLMADSFQGVIYIALSASLIALGGFIVKRYFKREETFALNAARSFIGGLCLLLVALMTQKITLPSIDLWPLFASGIVLANVIQYSFLYKAYEFEELEVVSTISALSPFFVLIFASVFLDTVPRPMEILGGTIMVFSTVGLILANKNLTK